MAFTYVTIAGVTVIIGGCSALLDGNQVLGRYGIVGGLALIVFSEWQRWRTKPSSRE
jgi:hypothetical protein